ncbi:MAG: tRNA (N6-threonylcarbamoyladenosine(37)-N6)-methyltransferase TrmO [Candidatus Aminicenantales bacterium]
MEIKFKAIGIAHSPFRKKEDIGPYLYSNSNALEQVQGELEIFKEYEAGLKDVECFSHLIVIFLFHKCQGFKLQTVPFGDDKMRGIFATRSPHRPNPIGLTTVKIIKRQGNIIKVAGVDMFEGTPILDLKPYTPKDQNRLSSWVGWKIGRK